MTANTRILLCRLGCIALCLAPTTIVAAWTCWRCTSGFAVAQRAEWQRELSLRTGLDVQIGGVSYPSLGLARLDDLQLLDPESRRPLARAAIVEIAAHAGGWQIELWQPHVQASGLARLARVLDERLLRGSPESLAPCDLAARELTIVRGQTGQSLLQCAARLSPRPEGTDVACEFRLPGANPPSAPVRLSLSRNRQQTPPATRWRLDTGGQSLPCELLADVLPSGWRLNASCRFAGAAAVVSSGDDWSGETAGRLGPLDLDALVTEQFPHQLSGEAMLEIERGVIDRGRLAELRGTIRAGHGVLSASLLAAAREHLELSADSRFAENPAAPIPFQQLAVRFHLDGRSLALAGEADPTQPGVLIGSANGPILSAPPGHSVAAIGLVRTLLPDSQYQVPATRQTGALVNLLPIPDLAAAATAHTPTRLAPAPAASPQPAVRQPAMR